MYLLADTHVHLYPCYDLEQAFVSGVTNLLRGAEMLGIQREEVVSKVLCLTERSDCDYFESLLRGATGSGFSVELTGEPEVLKISLPRLKEEIYLVAGKQIITKERIEVLALACSPRISDGLPLNETLEAVRKAGAIPVLSWAPGKWLFKRGKPVASAFGEAAPGAIACGDTSLRPPLWLEPLIMKSARKSGIQVIAGSDPLPFAGEERQCGRYATLIPMAKDSGPGIVKALRGAILATDAIARLQILGSRSSSFEVLARLRKNSRARSAGC